MTPKQKAAEIFNKMCNSVDELLPYDVKECALIAVDEILQINWYHSEPTCFDDLANEYKEKSIYWNEVKAELEKL